MRREKTQFTNTLGWGLDSLTGLLCTSQMVFYHYHLVKRTTKTIYKCLTCT